MAMRLITSFLIILVLGGFVWFCCWYFIFRDCENPELNEEHAGKFKAEVDFLFFKGKDFENYVRVYEHNFTTEYKNVGYIPEYQTKLIVHGYLDSSKSDLVKSLRKNFFNHTDEKYNIIAVDWRKHAKWVYPNVVNKTRALGNVIAHFLDVLVNDVGASLDNIHCIGHSLGAHICGFAGSSIKAGKINRITGLDPASPKYNGKLPGDRVDKSDAKFVDCIHTSDLWGIMDPICTADFYPNGGKAQHGWSWFAIKVPCHRRAYYYFAESLIDGHLFPSYQCKSFDFNAENCKDTGALMGYPAKNTLKGLFYCETASSYPYAKNWTFNSGISTTNNRWNYNYLLALTFIFTQKIL